LWSGRDRGGLRVEVSHPSAIRLRKDGAPSIMLFHWEEKRGLGNPRYSRPGGRLYISDGYVFMLSERWNGGELLLNRHLK
jgi:hypothetical protein